MNKNFDVSLSRINSLQMIFVVMMHSVITIPRNISDVDKTYMSIFNVFIFNTFTRCAVPIFFFISAFFLFRNFTNDKIISRGRTLLVPFIIWSFISYLLFLLLTHVSGVSNFINANIHLSFKDLFYNTIIHPINGPLWFLRDLCFLVLLSPIINKLGPKIMSVILVFLFLFWLFDNYTFFVESSLFFLLGFIMKTRPLNGVRFIENNFKYFVLMYISLCLFMSILYTFNNNIIVNASNWINKISIICGLLLVYGGRNIFKKNGWALLDKIQSFAFFIFVAHILILQGVKKILLILFNISSVVEFFVIYILAFFSTILILWFVFLLLKKICPVLLSVLTGYRC